MRVRYMCTVRPHEREFLTPPPRTPFCCGRPMKRMGEAEEEPAEEPGGGHDSGETPGSTASG